MLNGYPLQLVVPGYFGTYWVKHLSEIEVIDHVFDGHDAAFMTTAYRVPDNDCQCVAPGTAPAKTRPISTLAGAQLHHERRRRRAGCRSAVRSRLRGLAFDGGTGIRRVEVSIDGGATWRDATLGADLGRFSFRGWQLAATFPHARAGDG